jgi:hypothetical protein
MDMTEFVKDDYKAKVDYLVKHFERMWTRFSFLITLQTAVFAALSFAIEWGAKPAIFLFMLVGVAVSIFWIAASFEDRRLVKTYRDVHVKQAFEKMKELLKEQLPSDYKHVGEPATGPSQDRFSITMLPIYVASGFLVIWIVLVVAFIVAVIWYPESLEGLGASREG